MTVITRRARSSVDYYRGFKIGDRIFVYGANQNTSELNTINGIDPYHPNPFSIGEIPADGLGPWLGFNSFRMATADEDKQAGQQELERIEVQLLNLMNRRAEILSSFEDK